MTLPTYSRGDIIRHFGHREVEKAASYLADVDKLSVKPDRITGEVRGRAAKPYRVTVELLRRRGAASDFRARCSCPVGWNCKHAAALLLVALRGADSPTSVSPEVVAWLEEFRKAAHPVAAAPVKVPKRRQVLLYVLRMPGFGTEQWRVAFLKGHMNGEGGIVPPIEEWSNVERALLQPPRFVAPEDIDILRLFSMQKGKSWLNEYPLAGLHGHELMGRLLATGRFLFSDEEGDRLLPLAAGDERPGKFGWRRDPIGRLVPSVETDPPALAVLPAGGLWYLDLSEGRVGPVRTPCPPEQAVRLLTIPPLEGPDLPVVAAVLAEWAPSLPPPAAGDLRVIEEPPVPVLTLGTLPIHRSAVRHFGQEKMDFACPSFRYGEVEIAVGEKAEFVTDGAGKTVRLVRRPEQEASRIKALARVGLKRVASYRLYALIDPPKPLYGLKGDDAWLSFMQIEVPKLRAAGWEVRVPPDFRHHFSLVEAWQAEVSEEEGGWFNLDMGIVVEGRRLPLAPLLHDLFQREPRWLDAAQIEALADDERVILAAEGLRVAVPAARLKPLARTLIDLFDAPPGAALRLSRLDAARLGGLDHSDWQFKGAEEVRRLAERLRQGRPLEGVEPPAGFGLQLRPYQREGLAWLQFLREQGLAGILADDMGLGKTAQTLAHLLKEKEAGRLDRPALVVFPTSLLFNWRREAERCAPALRVLPLHGPERKDLFEGIPGHDVVLTTYPLLWRDADQLTAFEYHLVILDEAQTVKNAESKAAGVVRRLKARHRLCLTGTPLENHLGELWAQFDFLLPGFLGDARGFTRAFRTPIEKQGDALRRDLLARRIKPFILRRRKEEVARELPPKSIIVRSVELEGGQRDLYETVRSAMDEKVREAIGSMGFARSHIVILDALLKLRQICCDPRLLKIKAAGRVKERAKLDLLMAMLPELVEEGRRILIFSQFTGMLDLIADELNGAGLAFVTLTGQTRQRERVIERFQQGEAPIFLISLKAGGVGLNLTAADTVIHYDPWWNPAAENQATDRAHRIGQTRPVFVYKLIVAGSIEEKILALQEKKAELAAGILSEEAAALARFSESDIAALLAPLPSPDK